VGTAVALARAGAAIIDIGGESGVTNRPPVAAEEEIERVVPLIERVVAEVGVPVSVDTYKPAVAAAAVAAGACMVNDVSGLRDPAVADVCAATGAGLVVMHTRAEPKRKVLDPDLYPGGVAEDVATFLAERMALARDRGVAEEQIVLDPGPDFAKTPGPDGGRAPGPRRGHRPRAARAARDLAQGLRRRDHRRGPARAAGRDAGRARLGARTPGARLQGPRRGRRRDFLAVRAVLRGEAAIPDTATLPEHLRRV
jgi:dihydropteroate synthase